jgi:hypothetical protein
LDDANTPATAARAADNTVATVVDEPPKRKRGRPPKAKLDGADESTMENSMRLVSAAGGDSSRVNGAAARVPRKRRALTGDSDDQYDDNNADFDQYHRVDVPRPRDRAPSQRQRRRRRPAGASDDDAAYSDNDNDDDDDDDNDDDDDDDDDDNNNHNAYDFDDDDDDGVSTTAGANKQRTVGVERTADFVMERLLAHRFNADLQETEYLVKWKLRGYHACRWVTSSHLDAVGESAQRKRYEKKVKKSGAVDPERPFPRAFAVADRVLTHERDPATGVEHYLIKWAGLPYDESTWESRDALGEHAELLLEQFARRNALAAARAVRAKPRPDASEFVELDGDYAFKHGHQLRPYQREGFNWLRRCWFEQRNSILADEMGLGKTVQTVSIARVHAARL